ncbi:MAG: ADP-glyceromanno-heptose 6-epimerase [Planctomycetota bacterium]|nr:ADP-glyceromanno-heptose 6-epimerase [Planctomycetota bacterium]
MPAYLLLTGGAGFIGSNLVRELNRRGCSEIIVVDDLRDGSKFHNLRERRIADYLDKEELRRRLENGRPLPELRGILHQGACTDTMETDGRRMLADNFSFSKLLLHEALARKIPMVYASSAAVYGASSSSAESEENEKPLNLYGFSKLLFDRYVRVHCAHAASTVVGLRYFNVYGPGEAHKGRMASMAYQLYRQISSQGVGRLFQGCGRCAAGEQRRDFVYVADVVAVNLYFLEGPVRCGIWNVGTGVSRSFNELAQAVIAAVGCGRIEYIPFPEQLRGKYQEHTQADLRGLRAAGCDLTFTPLEDGIARAVDAWRKEDPASE